MTRADMLASLGRSFDRSYLRERYGRIRVVLVVVVLSLVALAAIRLTGGSPTPLNHLAYPPILLAAFFFGWRGALGTALLVALLLGPVPALLAMPDTEGPVQWVVRGVVFIIVGTLVGLAFDHLGVAVERLRGASEEITRSEARKGAMLRAALDAVIAADGDGIITEFNPSAESMFGFRADEIIGRPLVETIIPPAYRDRHQAAFDRHLATGETTIIGRRVQMEGRHATGRIFPIELTTYRVPTNGPPVLGAFIRDLSEVRRIEEHLVHAQKMESVGQLAGGIAHDFNNLLTAIGGYADLIRANPDLPEEVRADIVQIGLATERAAQLTHQLLAFSRRQVLQPASVDVGRILGEVEPMLHRLLPEEIMVVVRSDPGLWPVLVDPGQLTQVVVNLAVNARDAMPQGGEVRIEASNVTMDAESAVVHPGMVAGDYVTLTVRDGGFGMDAETRARIFDPFFTTKEPGKGTGLGLATVYGIVHQSGGRIWVYSEPGQGTVFRIYLPRTTETPAVVGEAVPQGSRDLDGSETILVVEDDDAVRRFTETVLRSRGYRVHPAVSPAAALEVVGTVGSIDLVVTDVVMPGMSGVELAARLRETAPTARVLFVSGYTEDALVHRGALDRGIAFLPKPYTAHELLARVRTELDGAPAGD